MFFLLLFIIALVPLVIGLTILFMLEKTTMAKAIFMFLLCVSLWEMDTAFLYAHHLLPESGVEFLFRLFRIGPIMLTPALFYVAYSMSNEVPKERRSRFFRSLVNKKMVHLFFYWGLFVYFIGWTKLGIEGLYLVEMDRLTDFMFPANGPWAGVFHVNVLLFVISLLICLTISRKIADSNKGAFLLVFSLVVAVGYGIGILNLFESSRLFPGAIAVIIFAILIFISITRMHTKIVQHMAYHDALTGLPNQRLFKNRLNNALEDAKRNKGMIAVLYMDLDRFKMINDTLGHSVGDMLLQHVAKRITGCLREQDTVSRQGGDEFTILMPGLTRKEVERSVKKIIDAFANSFQLHEHQLYMTPSIGISLYPTCGDHADILIKHADTAMYRVKEKGKNSYQFFNETMGTQVYQKLHMENALRKALKNDQFRLLYQPKFSIRTGKMVGVEALIRWEHPELGLVSPAEFIPLAEETGLIIGIGRWVLKRACAQCKKWQSRGLPDISVAVNLSMLQLRQENFVRMVRQALNETGLDPRYLELEITESMAMNKELFIHKLGVLKKFGVGISIDDFGTGYSSFGYIKQLPIDTLKIDSAFVNDITNSEDDAAIVQAIIAMAHILKLKVIAEGVETSEQYERLKQLECDAVQGYYLSRPLAADEVTKIEKGSS